MKVSLNTIKFVNQHYGSAGDPAPNGVDDLLQKIGAQLGAIEGAADFGKKFEGVIIVKVISCEDHPNADRLHVCKIDDSGRAQNVERDENGYVQVVCGAPNVREGLLVAWLPPGTTVPSTVGKEPFVLEAREIRGQKSNGMLASPKELSIGDSHDGILEITTDSDEHIAPGTPFADAYHLQGDVVIDIENKMFTHRPDCFGFIGVARELEGIQHRPYKSPDWYRLDPETPDVEAQELALEVHNELPELVPRFTVITMRDVAVHDSPLWLQIDLAKHGIRPINNIVDYTNFFMLQTGQPLHAYDYDKVKALSEGDQAMIVIRHPHQGEKITLLNGKEVEPRAEAVMIATSKQAIGIGGVMGGGETEVDEHTKNIILEVANFDMYSIRRTAMAHGIFTDAVTRFTKGQSPLQTKAVLAKIVDEIRRFAKGKVAGGIIDDNHLPADMLERGSVHLPVTVGRDYINARLGFGLSAEEMAQLLRNVEFDVQQNGDELTVSTPFWRTDIEIPEDVVEEVGRLYGFDHLPLELPKRDLTPAPKDSLLELKSRIRTALSRAGANEVLTYSFVHGNLLDKVGQNRDQAFQLANALSPDLQYYRLSLTPSLLEKIHPNIKAGYDQFALFEMGKAHIKGQEEDGLPREFDRLALVVTADKKAAQEHAGAPYYLARTYLMELLQTLGLAGAVVFEPLDPNDSDSAAAYYEPGRAATIKLGDTVIGRIGEYKGSVAKSLKLPAISAGFELGLEPLLHAGTAGASYVALPRFPKVEQDICLKVDAGKTYQEVYDFVSQHLGEHRPDKTHHTLTPIDIYQREGDTQAKQITLRLSIASFERTLTDDEVHALLDRVAQAAQEHLGAERV
ncbi:MAG TPA: phenylalanine--tRNA ligase subunit beta [Nevskiaceae bacterium]|nr:phenylalanine--tRNA ligase subunit beta [Nevskiaceae bacterium]